MATPIQVGSGFYCQWQISSATRICDAKFRFPHGFSGYSLAWLPFRAIPENVRIGALVQGFVFRNRFSAFSFYQLPYRPIQVYRE